MSSVRVLRLLVIASLLPICGCESNNKGKLEGTKWTSMGGKIKGVEYTTGTAFVEFQRNGKFTFRFGDRTHTGTYSFGMGDAVIMTFDKPLPTGKTHRESITLKEDRLTMMDPDGTKMTFSKD